ncbi:MAG: LysR family transcriptional regulator [Acidimicrobiia bacterium]
MNLLAGADLRHLAAVKAVAETGSFGRAAARLGFTQSAISQQIATLERSLGAPVFDRPGGPRPVELTPLGRVLVQHADIILRQVDAASEELAAVLAGSAGRLVVGSFQSVSVKVLPVVLGRLRAERPGVDLRVVESDDNEELLALLAAGELDLTFTIGRTDSPLVELLPLFEDEFVVLSPAADGVVDGPMPVRRLAGAPLIGQHACSCQTIIDHGLLQNGVEPKYVFRSNDNSAVQAMVRAGMGHAVMPQLAIDASDPGVVVRSLEPPLASRAIGLALPVGRTRAGAVDRFVEIAHEVCAELAFASAIGA